MNSDLFLVEIERPTRDHAPFTADDIATRLTATIADSSYLVSVTNLRTVTR